MTYPSVHPTGATIYDPARCWSGYTVFQAKEVGAFVIDMNGGEVQLWKMLHGMPNRILPGGHIIGSTGERHTAFGIQDGIDLVQVDWDGNIVWRFNRYEFIEDPGEEPQWMARQHHDYQREGNPVGYYAPGMEPLTDRGNTLILAHKNVTNPRICDKPLLDDAIIEVDWEGDVVWEWVCSDHFEELGFREDAKNVLFRNPNWRPVGGGMGDWMHINSMSLLGPNRFFDAGDARFHPDNIIWCARETNITAIIDKRTGAIVWRLGPNYDETPELRQLGWIIGQHHAHMIPRGLPGAGNLLIFDNGGWAGYGSPNPGSPTGFRNALRDYSRVLEIDPVTLEDRLAVHPGRSRLPLPGGRQPLLQPLHQLGPAPAERQHPDHRRLRRPYHRGDGGPRDRLGVHQPLQGENPEAQHGLPRLPAPVRVGAPGRKARGACHRAHRCGPLPGAGRIPGRGQARGRRGRGAAVPVGCGPVRPHRCGRGAPRTGLNTSVRGRLVLMNGMQLFTATGCARCHVVKRYMQERGIACDELDAVGAGREIFGQFYRKNRSAVIRGKEGIEFPVLVDGSSIRQGLGAVIAYLQAGGRLDGFFGRSDPRKGWVCGVLVSGGDAAAAMELCAGLGFLKRSGFKLEFNTDGRNADVLALLLEQGLGDRVVMELKGPAALYPALTGAPVDPQEIMRSMGLVARFGEFRFETTVGPVCRGGGERPVFSLLTPEEVAETARWLKEATGSHRQPYRLRGFDPAACPDEHLKRVEMLDPGALFRYRTAARRHQVSAEIESTGA